MPAIALPSRTSVRRPMPPYQDAPFAAILVDHPHEQAAAMAAFLAETAGPDTRVVRLRDPAQPHRKLQRIVAQVAGPAGEVVRGDQARLVVRALAERQGQERRVLLVIERAETLRPELLRSLQAMAPYFAEGHQPALQVLFVGRPIFRMLLDQRGIAPLRQALALATDAGGPTRATELRRPSRKPLLLLMAVLLGAAGAGYLALREPPSFDRALRATDMPPPTEAPSPPDRDVSGASGLLAPPPASVLPAIGSPATVPPPLEVAPARPAIPAGPRVVIHVPSGSDRAEALSARLVATLRVKSATVEVRRVPETPRQPSLRYFYAGDEPAARQTAARAAATGLNCLVEDFTSFRPLPSRGTVEIWLPRPAERDLASRSDADQVN